MHANSRERAEAAAGVFSGELPRPWASGEACSDPLPFETYHSIRSHIFKTAELLFI